MTILVSSFIGVINAMVGGDSSEPFALLISLPARWPRGRPWRESWKGWQIARRALEEGSHLTVTERSLVSKHSCVEFQTNPCHRNLCPDQYMFPTHEKPLTETTDPEVWILTLPSWLSSFHRFSAICEISCLWTLFFFFLVRKGWWMLNMSQLRGGYSVNLSGIKKANWTSCCRIWFLPLRLCHLKCDPASSLSGQLLSKVPNLRAHSKPIGWVSAF